MELFDSFKNSLLLPKKEALFRLNRISMRNAISYIVLLMFLLFLPDLIQNLLASEGMDAEVPESMYILQLIVFYPFMVIFLTMAGVSALAALSVLIKIWMERKLAYQQLWKMTAFALTLPSLIYLLLGFLPLHPVIVNVLPLVLLYFLIWKMIAVYPKKRK